MSSREGEPKRTGLPDETAGIVALLSHPNGHVRDTAQRVLVERGDAAVAREVEKIATTGATPQARAGAVDVGRF